MGIFARDAPLQELHFPSFNTSQQFPTRFIKFEEYFSPNMKEKNTFSPFFKIFQSKKKNKKKRF